MRPVLAAAAALGCPRLRDARESKRRCSRVLLAVELGEHDPAILRRTVELLQQSNATRMSSR